MERAQEILKEELFKFPKQQGFKKFEEEDWKIFDQSGAMQAVVNAMMKYLKEHETVKENVAIDTIQIDNLQKAFNDTSYELQDCKRLNNELITVLQIFVDELAGSADTRQKALRVLNLHKA